MFLPEQWPSYFERAAGVEIWDLDGNSYIDMCYNALGACVLGVADPDVDAAVVAAIGKGTISTLNCPEEVALADVLCKLHPWAEMARFARCGGEAMAVAVRIARSATGRSRVAFCGYHGWHDWYLAANLSEPDALGAHLIAGLAPDGVPQQLAGTAVPFHYNRADELTAIVDGPGEPLAAIVMEPIRLAQPEPGFLDAVRKIATAAGAVLIYDEVSAGFRLTTGGSHLTLGCDPDMAVLAKALGNGYPTAAVIGRADVMQAAQHSFISSTFWTERIGSVAALATIQKHGECDVATHLIRIGERIQHGLREAADRAGLPIHVRGIAPLTHFTIDGPESQPAHTLFTQMMLDSGFLATKGFYSTYAHTDAHVDRYLEAAEAAFRAIAAGDIAGQLRGPVAHTRFERLA